MAYLGRFQQAVAADSQVVAADSQFVAAGRQVAAAGRQVAAADIQVVESLVVESLVDQIADLDMERLAQSDNHSYLVDCWPSARVVILELIRF